MSFGINRSVVLFDIVFWGFASDTLEEATETADGWEVENTANLSERGAMCYHQGFCLLYHGSVNPGGCVLLAVAHTHKGEVLVRYAKLLGIILYRTFFYRMLVEQGKEFNIHIILTRRTVSLKWNWRISMDADVFDNEGIHQATYIGKLELIGGQKDVSLDVDVDLKHCGHLLSCEGG